MIEGSLEPKLSKEAVLEWSNERRLIGADECGTHKVEFEVDSDFGIPGAVTVINNYETEFFLESITIERCVHFGCKSWIQPNTLHPEKRVFFTNKVYLATYTTFIILAHLFCKHGFFMIEFQW